MRGRREAPFVKFHKKTCMIWKIGFVVALVSPMPGWLHATIVQPSNSIITIFRRVTVWKCKKATKKLFLFFVSALLGWLHAILLSYHQTAVLTIFRQLGVKNTERLWKKQHQLEDRFYGFSSFHIVSLPATYYFQLYKVNGFLFRFCTIIYFSKAWLNCTRRLLEKKFICNKGVNTCCLPKLLNKSWLHSMKEPLSFGRTTSLVLSIGWM